MNWKQIYALSDPQDRTDEILNLLQIIEARQRRPAFLRKFYISPRLLRQSLPSQRVFAAVFFSLPMHIASYENFGIWAIAAIVIDISLVPMLFIRRLRRELLKVNHGPLTA